MTLNGFRKKVENRAHEHLSITERKCRGRAKRRRPSRYLTLRNRDWTRLELQPDPANAGFCAGDCQACGDAGAGSVNPAVRVHAPQSALFTLPPLTILQNGKLVSPPPALKAMPLPPSTSWIVTKAPGCRNPLTTPP